jgi:very-short-patch-repair endonuclease
MNQKTINKIIQLYISGEISNIEKLAVKFNTGKNKIRQILKENDIKINSKGGQSKTKIKNIAKFKIPKNSPPKGFKKIAICKKTKKEFNDWYDRGGHLSKHIKQLYPNIKIPSETEKKKHYINNNEFWFEKYFLITLKPIPEKTIKQSKPKINKDFLTKCEICGKELKIINNQHLKTHKTTVEKYKKNYPDSPILSEKMLKLYSDNLMKTMINSPSPKSWESKGEKEVKDFINSIGIKTIKFKNKKLLNGYELDIVIDDLKIAIEYNGLYYHSEKMGKDKNYHYNKMKLTNEKGYKLIQIFEDEWLHKKEIVKSKLKHILGKSSGTKIGGRNLKIKKIKNPKEKNNFLNNCHIQGSDKANISLGAYYNDLLVGVMTFKTNRNMSSKLNDGEFELNRFATKSDYVISGLANKFLKYFIVNYNPKRIISFADRCWTLDIEDNLYTKLGFKIEKILRPDYSYFTSKGIHKNKRIHKFNLGKNRIKKKYPDININRTEKEIAEELGYSRIFDCGKVKYILEIKGFPG